MLKGGTGILPVFSHVWMAMASSFYFLKIKIYPEALD